ncbi:MAG: hypothetical protein ACKPKO_02530, partial [Candidatus Fonsibacter sp.]
PTPPEPAAGDAVEEEPDYHYGLPWPDALAPQPSASSDATDAAPTPPERPPLALLDATPEKRLGLLTMDVPTPRVVVNRFLFPTDLRHLLRAYPDYRNLSSRLPAHSGRTSSNW